jgi:cytochrome c2
MRTLSAVTLVGLVALAPLPAMGDGDARRGQALVEHYGCGACHEIPQIPSAHGLVGPPLTHIGSRVFIAGVLRNTPQNMTKWILSPQSIVPGNAMPQMPIEQSEAQDITAFLEAIK